MASGDPLILLRGSRVKFRDDHEDYPGMHGTITEVFTFDPTQTWLEVTLDAVAATAEELEAIPQEANRGE